MPDRFNYNTVKTQIKMIFKEPSDLCQKCSPFIFIYFTAEACHAFLHLELQKILLIWSGFIQPQKNSIISSINSLLYWISVVKVRKLTLELLIVFMHYVYTAILACSISVLCMHFQSKRKTLWIPIRWPHQVLDQQCFQKR